MTARRFAEDTKVSIGHSQGEVKDLLKRAGATKTAIYEDERGSSVMFQIDAGMYRVAVPIPKAATAAKSEQEERRAWRLMLLLIRAKLEAVREGATTIEREFLSDRLLHGGQTIGQWAARELEEATRIGRMPTSLLLSAPPAGR